MSGIKKENTTPPRRPPESFDKTTPITDTQERLNQNRGAKLKKDVPSTGIAKRLQFSDSGSGSDASASSSASSVSGAPPKR